MRPPRRNPIWFELISTFGPEGETPRPIATEKAEGSASITLSPALGWDAERVAFSIPQKQDALIGTMTTTAMRRSGDFTDVSLSNWARFVQSAAPALLRLALAEVGKQHLHGDNGAASKPENDKDSGNHEKWDIFLSYSSSDIEEAKALSRKASRKGLKIFLAAGELSGGDDFIEKIRCALLGSSELCVLMTPKSLESDWVMTEWGAAWAVGKRITPILLRCTTGQLPERLRVKESVDFHEAEKYFGEVAKRLRTSPGERRDQTTADRNRAKSRTVGDY